MFKLSFVAIVLLTLLLLLNDGWPLKRVVGRSHDVACNVDPAESTAHQQAATLTLELWAPAEPHECWRLFAPVKAAAAQKDLALRVQAKPFEIADDAFAAMFTAAAQAGSAPDIAYAIHHATLKTWVDAGYLTPLDACVQQHAEFADVYPDLWQAFTWNGHIWGIPNEVALNVLFFNKAKLKEMGYADAWIDSLPQRIGNGEFTMDDMLATAQDAIRLGVVDQGFGVWRSSFQYAFFRLQYAGFGGQTFTTEHPGLLLHPAALQQTIAWHGRLFQNGLILPIFGREINQVNGWLNRNVFHDTVTRGRVLFWMASLNDWGDWRSTYVGDIGGEQYLRETVGVAPFPSGIRGQAGNALWHRTSFYVIPNEQATGRKQQATACTLLAKNLRPAFYALQILGAATIGVTNAQATDPAFGNDYLAAQSRFLWQYQRALSPWEREEEVGYGGIVDDFTARVEQGELSADEAARLAIQQIQLEYGDQLLIVDSLPRP